MAHNPFHTKAQEKIRENQRRMAKNALRSADASALKNVKKRLRKGTKSTAAFTTQDLQAMRRELDAESPHMKRMRMPAGKGPVRETAKTHGKVWDQRWGTGGLKKTFGTKTSYGLSTRPDRWYEMTRRKAPEFQPEFRTGPRWNQKTGWGGPERGRWYWDSRFRQWRRG